MIRKLLEKYGKDKINTFTKYPSILTLHRIGEKGRLTNELTTTIDGVKLYGTEKIDGTNVRIICYGDEYLVGSREFILHHSNDIYFDPAQGIVDGLKTLRIPIPKTDDFTVIYGEFYGGKTTTHSKWYGQDKIGFRVFDVSRYDYLDVLEFSIPEISRWRERETPYGMFYGQPFLTRTEIENTLPDLDLVPVVDFDLGDMTHKTILENLRKYIPTTNVPLSDNALMKAEGLVLRNENRNVIVKVRYEDYERTVR
jgi:hypothetical protein